MNNKNLHDNLEGIIAPEVQNQSHQRRLRAALLAAYNEGSSTQSSFGLSQLFTPLRVFSASGVTVALIVAIVVFGLTPQNSPEIAHAEAQEIIEEALVGMASLPEEERAELGQVLGINVTAALAEAYDAPDLTYIGTQDIEVEFEPLPTTTATASPRSVKTIHFMHEAPHQPVPSGPPGELSEEEQARLRELRKDVRVLKFTDSKGRVVQMGIGADRRPVIRVIDEIEESEDNEEVFERIQEIREEQQERMEEKREKMRRYYAAPDKARGNNRPSEED